MRRQAAILPTVFGYIWTALFRSFWEDSVLRFDNWTGHHTWFWHFAHDMPTYSPPWLRFTKQPVSNYSKENGTLFVQIWKPERFQSAWNATSRSVSMCKQISKAIRLLCDNPQIMRWYVNTLLLSISGGNPSNAPIWARYHFPFLEQWQSAEKIACAILDISDTLGIWKNTWRMVQAKRCWHGYRAHVSLMKMYNCSRLVQELTPEYILRLFQIISSWRFRVLAQGDGHQWGFKRNGNIFRRIQVRVRVVQNESCGSKN